MESHQYAMSDARESALRRIRGEDVEPEERDDWSPADETLCIDVRTVHDIMLTVGGPTCYFRIWSQDGEPYRGEYVDSWAHPIQSVDLTWDELQEVVDAFGPWIEED